MNEGTVKKDQTEARLKHTRESTKYCSSVWYLKLQVFSETPSRPHVPWIYTLPETTEEGSILLSILYLSCCRSWYHQDNTTKFSCQFGTDLAPLDFSNISFYYLPQIRDLSGWDLTLRAPFLSF